MITQPTAKLNITGRDEKKMFFKSKTNIGSTAVAQAAKSMNPSNDRTSRIPTKPVIPQHEDD